MADYRSLSEVLACHSYEFKKRSAFRVQDALSGELVGLSYEELDECARNLASGILRLGLGGSRIALALPTGIEFLTAFFGIAYAGSIAVPLNPARNVKSVKRLATLLENADPAAVLGTEAFFTRAQSQFGGLTALTVEELSALATDPSDVTPTVGQDAIAMIQYTSGSTATPKGVEITHGNFLHNATTIAEAGGLDASKKGAMWLPLFHDMGLMGGVIAPLVAGCENTLLQPVSFMKNPLAWLKMIQEVRATHSAAPNFAFEHCVDKISEENAQDLDLSSLEVVYCGAEPIRPATMDRFAHKFQHTGFRKTAFFPCYGLAESTLFVSGVGVGRGVNSIRASRKILNTEKCIAETSGDELDTLELVSTGRPFCGAEVYIVKDGECQALEEGREGEIWVKSRSVAQGYFRSAEATARTFVNQLGNLPGPFLKTGDLGFLLDGQLYITGRIKDMIVARGINHYPQDIELTCEDVSPALVAGGSAAFGVGENDDQLTLLVEVKGREKIDPKSLCCAIREAISSVHGLEVNDIVLTRQGSLPRTSSGKIQRQTAKSIFKAETVNRVLFHDSGGAEALEEVSRPETDTEQLLLGIWLKVLPEKEIGVTESFFSVGGTSLQLAEAHAEIASKFNTNIDISTLFEFPTIREFAAFLDEGRSDFLITRAAARGERRKSVRSRKRSTRG